MTSSGTYSFQPSLGSTTLVAFSRIGVRPTAIVPEQLNTAYVESNLLLAEWANKGVNLWKSELQEVTLTEGEDEYSLPSRTVTIMAAYIRTNEGTATQTDRIMSAISTYEYAALPNKTNEAFPTVYWYNRQITPILKLWPVPDDNGPYKLMLQTMVQVQDANLSSGETPDIPYRWFDCFCTGLAYRLSKHYAQQMEQARKQDYMEAWEAAAAEDTEEVPYYIYPALGQYYR